MTTAARTLTAVALGVVAALGPAWAAQAACVAPDLTVNPASGPAGSEITVIGRAFAAECRDTGQPEPSPPVTGVPLLFEQSGLSQRLSTVDADPQTYGFTVVLRVPPSAAPGAAVLVADADYRIEVPFTVTPVAAVQPPAAPPTELPRTGPRAALAATGAALALAGCAAAAGGRRRPRPGRAR